MNCYNQMCHALEIEWLQRVLEHTFFPLYIYILMIVLVCVQILY